MSVNPNDLRALADFLDEHPALAEEVYLPSVDAYVFTTDVWAQMLRELGQFRKEDGGTQLCATRTIGSLDLRVVAPKEATCERVQVAEREVVVEVYPENVVPALVTTTEPVYEWRCPPSWIAADEALETVA